MDDQDKTEEQLRAELATLRQRVAALQESEERFRKVFEEGPIGLLLVGTDGRIQHANRRFCEMLGRSESEIIAAGLAGISHPDDWARDHPFVSRLWRGEISLYHVEKRYLRKDGQHLWGQLTVSLMHDEAGKPINTIGMVEDITQRKQAVERLQESERRLRTLIDASPESILLLDTDETILLANETSARRLGRPMDRIIGKRPRDILSLKATAERTRNFEGVVRTGKAVRFDDERSGRYYENAMHPILDNQGAVVAVAVLAIDRTEQKRAAVALQQAHDELEQKVNERTAELTKVNEALRKEYRTLKHLLQSSDHERQVIAYEIHDGLAQQLAAAIMQFQTFAHLRDKKPRPAAKAFDAGTTMLQQSHYEARRLIAGVRPPILDESGVVAAVGHLVNEQVRLKGPRIDYHSRVDFDRLAPILENAVYRIAQEALMNACRHGKSARVRVSLLQQGDRVRVEIRDWGVGFDPKAVLGTRFGLEGIRQRTRLLGGRCRIRSAMGKGTRITVELPVVERQTE